MNHIIVRYAEIGLKGDNRPFFEKLLCSNLKNHLKHYDIARIHRLRGKVMIDTPEAEETLLPVLAKVPGIANFSPMRYTELKMEEFIRAALAMVQSYLDRTQVAAIPFRVSAKRVNKRFGLKSEQIERELGAQLVETFPALKVNLNHPILDVGLEVWDHQAVIYLEKIKGLGGLPVDGKHKVVSLLSGGIDSPVASWMIMRRGCKVVPLHFHSFPFVGQQSRNKVIDLVKVLADYQPHTRLYICSFAEIQKAVKAHCQEKNRTVHYRRLMHRIADRVAHQERARALVSGDNLSQVASQTLDNIYNTNEATQFPLLRPLIGLDKAEITERARQIGTFDLSIQDFPDCCTVFQPRHPSTRAWLPDLLESEAAIPELETLLQEAVQTCEVLDFECNPNGPDLTAAWTI